jgi:hypothetical protein
MGQPTGLLLQRSGRTQLWEQMAAIGVGQRGYAEHSHRILQAVGLLRLLFKSLPVDRRLCLWYQPLRSGLLWLYSQHRWQRRFGGFPTLTSPSVVRRYFITVAPHFLLQDGDSTFFSIGYNHRRLRVDSLF